MDTNNQPITECSPLHIGLILGSTRPGRRGDQIASWVLDTARHHGGATYELIDLADYNLGNLDEPNNPTLQAYQHEHTRKWGQLIDRFDGYVFITPEYNHSIPGSLKNALDYVYKEWNDKAAGIVCYGGWVAGSRAAEALRIILPELQIASVRGQVCVSTHATFGTGVFVANAPLTTSVEIMLMQLLAWAKALRSVRQEKANSVG